MSSPSNDAPPLTNWAGNVTFSTPTLHRPATVEQVQELVSGADRIHALGTGHSFSRIADSSGALLSVADLAGPVEIDEAARTVSFPAGLRFGELAVALDARGWALGNLGSLPHISAAGACATGTHGSGVGNTCIAATATAVEFVDGTGTLHRITKDDDMFAGAVLSVGALGIVTRLTFAVVPSFGVRQDVWLGLPWASFVADADAILTAGYSVSVFTEFRWDGPDGTADKLWIKSLADSDPADARVWGATAATTPQNPVTGHDPSAATEQLGAPGPWHERLPHFRLAFTPSNGHEQQSEYLLDRRHTGDVLAALGRIGPSLRPALEVCEIRTVAADDLWLSPCHGRDTLAVHITWVDDDELVAPALARLERALTPFDPRPHWGKVFAQPAEQVRAHYPRLGDFRELVERHDPQRRFVNPFLQTYVY